MDLTLEIGKRKKKNDNIFFLITVPLPPPLSSLPPFPSPSHSSGELYVFNVDHEDGYKSYSCRTVNKLTGKIQSSYYPAHLIVTGDF